MKKIKQKRTKTNYATPGDPMTDAEFKSFVEEAENGTFHPVSDLKKDVIAVWKKKYGK